MNSNVPCPEKSVSKDQKSSVGLLIGGAFGLAGLAIVGLATPFVLPALRKHCLPYVPATDTQLYNLSKAFGKHARKGYTFVDVGSGDGRICRLAAQQKLFSQVHGVELNYMLVLFSRIYAIKLNQFKVTKYHHKDLWRFPLKNYDTVCIFGVESMMESLERYLKENNTKPQLIVACRFPFRGFSKVDEIGEGIDTVWVYKLGDAKSSTEY